MNGTTLPRWLAPLAIGNAVAVGIVLLLILVGLNGTVRAQGSAGTSVQSSAGTASSSSTPAGVTNLPKQVGGC